MAEERETGGEFAACYREDEGKVTRQPGMRLSSLLPLSPPLSLLLSIACRGRAIANIAAAVGGRLQVPSRLQGKVRGKEGTTPPEERELRCNTHERDQSSLLMRRRQRLCVKKSEGQTVSCRRRGEDRSRWCDEGQRRRAGGEQRTRRPASECVQQRQAPKRLDDRRGTHTHKQAG